MSGKIPPEKFRKLTKTRLEALNKQITALESNLKEKKAKAEAEKAKLEPDGIRKDAKTWADLTPVGKEEITRFRASGDGHKELVELLRDHAMCR